MLSEHLTFGMLLLFCLSCLSAVIMIFDFFSRPSILYLEYIIVDMSVCRHGLAAVGQSDCVYWNILG